MQALQVLVLPSEPGTVYVFNLHREIAFRNHRIDTDKSPASEGPEVPQCFSPETDL